MNLLQVHRLLSKVEEMKAQRSMLMDQFRSEVHEDDITKKLVRFITRIKIILVHIAAGYLSHLVFVRTYNLY